MRWSIMGWLGMVMVVVVFMGATWTSAAPNPSIEDIYRDLLKLDRTYSVNARPSLRSVSTSNQMSPKEQRALSMMTLHRLDSYYGPKSRPRFGKRAEINVKYSPMNYENQFQSPDVDEWVPVRR